MKKGCAILISQNKRKILRHFKTKDKMKFGNSLINIHVFMFGGKLDLRTRIRILYDAVNDDSVSSLLM